MKRLLCLGLCATVFGACAAADYPPRKPGLWETSMQTEGKGGADRPAPHVSQQCVDAASDKALREMGMGMGKDMCSKQDMRSEGGKLVVDSVCNIGNTAVTTHGVISGDFGTAYRMEMRSSYNPPMMGRADGNSVIEARWLGPCKADQKPGDMIMPNGSKMNLLDVMKNAPKAPK